MNILIPSVFRCLARCLGEGEWQVIQSLTIKLVNLVAKMLLTFFGISRSWRNEWHVVWCGGNKARLMGSCNRWGTEQTRKPQNKSEYETAQADSRHMQADHSLLQPRVTNATGEGGSSH